MNSLLKKIKKINKNVIIFLINFIVFYDNSLKDKN